MKAANMKKLLIGLGLLLVLGALAYRYGPGLFMARMFEPKMSFIETTPPPQPDYNDLANWSAWPGRADTADQLPQGVTAPAEADRKAAVFYIHPTVFNGNEAWNADVSDDLVNLLVDYLPVLGQATVFNKCCQIYAPRYRQATLWTYIGAEEQSGLALNLAYQDVEAAFDHFLATVSPDMPIILASHSQGSTHLYRLLAQRVWNTALMDRLVVAYVVGVYTPTSHINMILPDMPICERADDTGCMVTWDTYRPDGDPMVNPNPMTHWVPDGSADGTYISPPLESRMCQNPLDWNEPKGGAVPIWAGGLGATFVGGEADTTDLPRLGSIDETQVTGACRNGGLVLNDPYPTFLNDHPVFGPGGSLHLMDYSVVYMDLFHNAARRVDAYLHDRRN